MNKKLIYNKFVNQYLNQFKILFNLRIISYIKSSIMEEKNNYAVENEKIIFRRACLNDNMEEIAELIYDTDKYIYPFGLIMIEKKLQSF